MKATYLKPTMEEIKLSYAPIMLNVSGDGQKLVEDGGSTSGSGVTEADSRSHSSLWDDEEW